MSLSGIRGWRPLRRSEAQNAEEDRLQEEESKDGSDATPESLGDRHVGQNDEDDVDEDDVD